MTDPTMRKLQWLLIANLVVMAGVLVAVLSDRGSVMPAANAQVVAPIAGGAGLFLMPGQLTRDRWGCYVMDVDAQNLVVYEYNPGDDRLKLMAARHFGDDRLLQDYNTWPPPREIRQLVEDARNRERLGDEPANATPQTP